MNKVCFLVLFVALFCQQSVKGESEGFIVPDDSLYTSLDMEISAFSKIQLPPISLFLDAAKEYANVKYYEARGSEEEALLKVSRKEWLKYFRGIATYQYGTNNAYMLNSSEMLPNESAKYSSNTQNWYNIGASLAVPLDDLFSRKNKNDVVRSRIAQSRFEQERAIEERQLVILEAYNRVVKTLSLLKVHAESVALYNAQMKISERDFVNGQIDIISLSLERARRTAAMVNYQESRAELHNSVTILELLTKIKILKD